MSLYLSARYPDLIGGASAFNPGPEFYVGDRLARIVAAERSRDEPHADHGAPGVRQRALIVSISKNATIIFVNGGSEGVFNAFQYAIDNITAPVISVSYGACEADWGQTNLNTLVLLGQQANAQGQTIVAAAGDSGAADCDYSSSTTPVTSATHGLAVDAPASVPNVTGMGGSEFNEGSGNYWQAATTATGDILTFALSYIPEMAWNDTSSTENTSHQLLAGGGGASSFFGKPTWQTGTGVPNDNARDVPDLSLNASPVHDSYLICVQGKCVNGYRNTDQTLTVAGGTSFGTPSFAGIVALINQQMNTPAGQGNINPTLYAMATTSPAAFHDIAAGNNMVPCTAGSTGCPANGQIGYSAGVGYDQASGLGSINAFNLVTAWGSSGTLAAPTLSTPANGATAVSTPAHIFVDYGHRECRLSNINCYDANRSAHKSFGRDLRRLHD